MPASLRAHVSRAHPYDRSPTASPAQSQKPIDADQDADVDVPQDHPGLPTYAEYKRIEANYLHSLSPRKRDKALITQAMFDKIWDVLHQPEACTIQTPQFRFWVRKMFTLSRPVRGDGDGVSGWGWDEGRTGGRTATAVHPVPEFDPDMDADLELERSMGIIGSEGATADELGYSAVVLHENRPVAIMEQLYELFCYCHVRAGHGGRDKTCAVIREHYSWVPKELTAQFVKACPTCVSKRSGYAHGADVGVSAHSRVGRGRRGRVVPLEVEAEETPVPVVPVRLSWPTTGGPLDPANPEPRGVRERERERLRAHGDVGPVDPSSPVSPARGSRTHSVSLLESCLENGWSSVPRALTLSDMSPFRPCDTARSLGQLFALNNSPARPSNRDQKEKENRSPTRTGLPSLASALSNESLDDNVNLTELELGFAPATRDAADSERVLPLALRPLRLTGPVSDFAPTGSGMSSYPLQIDPMLLSFNYPGLGLSSESKSEVGVRFGQSPDGHRRGIATLPSHALSPTRLCASPMTSVHLNLPALEAPCRGDYSARPDAVSLSTECMERRRCGSRYDYRDGPLGMLYPQACSAVEVGQELDTPLSFSIMADV
ncbi:hypothetical protein JVT61DRAFT_14556 [Boletus reticuloceps]|uniref:Integrase zinc-binding domain-containing protein n=1 Tax=Boletus reticuloceps TaxID=495285 RepID=A0A8I3AAA6_9AGAM|nr:hypothetical protein JVT61DRAFT_14556 [Boletus reticuloceps]